MKKRNIRIRIKKRSRVAKEKVILLQNLFFLNISLTKTNSFCSITTFKAGNVLFIETPRKYGFTTTMRRKDQALQHVLTELIKKFFFKYNKKIIQFIVQISGKRLRRSTKKLIRFLLKKLKLRPTILYILYKQSLPHNGCKREVRRRKKRRKKGRFKFI